MGMGQGLYLGLYISDLDFSCGRINERTDGLRGQEALADLKIAKKIRRKVEVGRHEGGCCLLGPFSFLKSIELHSELIHQQVDNDVISYMIYHFITSFTSAKSFLQRFRIINIIFISVEFLVLHPSLHLFQYSHCFVSCEAINCRQMVATVGSIELSFNLPLTIIIGPRRLPLTVNYERNISKATADPTVAFFYIATGQHRLNVYKICHFVAVLLQKFKNSSSC